MAMKLHHIGIACSEIQEALAELKKIYTVSSVGPVVFDSVQNASLCMVETEHGVNFELVTGDRVSGLLKRKQSYYHLCYEVSDLEAETLVMIAAGAVAITKAEPAVLFDNRRVRFFMTPTGMIELLEAGSQ